MSYVYDSPIKDKPGRKQKGTRSENSDDSDGDYGLPQSRNSSPETSSDPGASDDEPAAKRTAPNLAPLNPSSDFTDPFTDALADTGPSMCVPSTAAPPAIPAEDASRFTSGINEAHVSNVRYCGLCASYHGPLVCPMTKDTISLAEYRKLIIYKSQEAYETRVRSELLTVRGVQTAYA